jgi:hypothetical protein
MTKLEFGQLLAAIAVVCSVASLAVLASVALRTGTIPWPGFAISLVILIGAGSRLRGREARSRRGDSI